VADAVIEAFILTCGIGHLVDIWNIWNSAYWLSMIVRVVTALASIGTAVTLWPLIPVALKIPSTKLLEEEIVERQKADKELRKIRDNLEVRVQERTYELEEFNRLAVEREERMIVLKMKINELCSELGRQPEYDLSFLSEPGNIIEN
jgi:C4-dicarboxylate-specific signal transduction histidine kinase